MYTHWVDKEIKRWWDIPSVILLLIALWLPALRLSLTKWTPDLSRMEFLVALAVGVGLAVGYSRIKKWMVAPLLLVVSLIIVPWQLTRSLAADTSFLEVLKIWLVDLDQSLKLMLSNQPVQTPVIFLTTMGILFWSIGVIGGYSLIRFGKPWLAVMLAGVVLFLVDFYHPYLKHPARYTGAFVFAILLLIARLFYLRSRRDWDERAIRIDYDTGYGIGRSAILAGFFLILVAWNFTSVVNFFRPPNESGISGFWENLENRFENIVLGLQNSGISTGDFGNNLSLGSTAAQGENVVFKVYLNPLEVEDLQLYWRGHSYDRYEFGQWRNSLTSAQTLDPDEWPLPYPDWQGRKALSIEISPQTRVQRTLFSPSLPLSLERSAEVIGSLMPDGTFDVVSLVVNPSIGIGDDIQMRVWLSAPTVTELRSAGQEYPPFIENLYLDVPESLQEKFRQLAEQITIGMDNPYDQVMAITTYLRQNIDYQLTVNPAPIDRDPLEYFLFDSRAGYCNYYASAAVLLIRAIGVPARLAVGYSEGLYQGAAYEVRTKNSHAWSEVFFPGYGWVEFEPTSIQPQTEFPLQRSDDGDVFSREGLGEEADEGGEDPLAGRVFGEPPEDEGGIAEEVAPIIPWGLLILGSLVLGFAILTIIIINRDPRMRGKNIPDIAMVILTARNAKVPDWLRSWSRFSGLSPIARRYAVVNVYLLLLGVHSEPGLTPRERIDLLVERIPALRYNAYTILEEFQRESFSAHPGNDLRAREAFRAMTWQLIKSFGERLVRV